MATSIDLSNFNLELNLTKQLEHQLRGMLEGICTCIMVKCSLITYPSLLTSMPYLKDLDLSHNTLTDIKWSVGQLPLL
jgi:Leucine-rich repeat (LRR) protein